MVGEHMATAPLVSMLELMSLGSALGAHREWGNHKECAVPLGQASMSLTRPLMSHKSNDIRITLQVGFHLDDLV